MDNMYEIIAGLCSKNKISPSAMCKEIGVAKSLMTELKKGRSKKLSMANAQKIANYFDVPVDYLLGNEKKPVQNEDELIKDEFIAFYGDTKKNLKQADIDDIKALIRLRAELNRSKE